MGSSSSSSSSGIGFFGLLTVLFIGLKLIGFITWNWFWVLIPIWGGFLFWMFILLIIMIIAIIAHRY